MAELRTATKEELLAQFLDLTTRAGEVAASLNEAGDTGGNIIDQLQIAQALALSQQYIRERKTANWFSGLVKWIPK